LFEILLLLLATNRSDCDGRPCSGVTWQTVQHAGPSTWSSSAPCWWGLLPLCSWTVHMYELYTQTSADIDRVIL